MMLTDDEVAVFLFSAQVCLRQVDMELLCQLWTINEQITELRKRWEAGGGGSNGGGGQGDNVDEEEEELARGTPAGSAILEVEEMEQEDVLDGEEEFRMRNGGERKGEELSLCIF